MDIPRGQEVIRRRSIRRAILIVLGVAIIGGGAYAVTKLKPAAPSVDSSTIWKDTVKRGPMIINVRGLGRLTPGRNRLDPSRLRLPRGQN